MLQYQTILVL